MLDKGFFRILVKELPMKYRKYIFNPPSGKAAKNVHGREYPAYSTKYEIAKKTGQMKRKPVKKAQGGMVTKWENKWG